VGLGRSGASSLQALSNVPSRNPLVGRFRSALVVGFEQDLPARHLTARSPPALVVRCELGGVAVLDPAPLEYQAFAAFAAFAD
jgi:hypothetical protein